MHLVSNELENVFRRLSTPTNFQEFVEQAEGVTLGQVIVAQPVAKFASITWLNASLFILTGFSVTVTTFPLQLFLCFCILESLQPSGKYVVGEMRNINTISNGDPRDGYQLFPGEFN